MKKFADVTRVASMLILIQGDSPTIPGGPVSLHTKEEGGESVREIWQEGSREIRSLRGLLHNCLKRSAL